MNIVGTRAGVWGFYSRARQTATQRNTPTKRAQKATCSMFFLLLAGLISSLIHGDVKPQIRLHLWSCLAARLCLVPRPLLRQRQTVEGIIDNVLCYHPPAPPFPWPPAGPLGPRHTTQWGPVRWVHCTNLIWSTAATATRLTSGEPISEQDDSEPRDRKMKCVQVMVLIRGVEM